MNKMFEGTGFYPADILLPQGCDMHKWSVVACDQFTSQPQYWEDVEATVGEAPSAFRLILPEIFLGSDAESRAAKINAKMRDYLESGILRTLRDSFIYVERTFFDGRVRRGLVGAVDLDEYDFNAGARPLVRATEGTVLDRIPPRVRVRKNAPLEVPHVMLLIDDPGRTVIEAAAAHKDGFEKLYDFELMKGGGHVAGYAVGGEYLPELAAALASNVSQAEFAKKYGSDKGSVMAYAVGDGNHSLATAKECWEQLKARLTPAQAQCHPARYALVELVNIHDESLIFEPIHRVIFDVEPKTLIKAFLEYYPSAQNDSSAGNRFEYVCADAGGVLTCGAQGLAVGLLQAFFDDYTARYGGRIDYIHGEDVVRALSSRARTVGFLLPPMGKSELFTTVIRDGALPRKTFSMGEPQEKRYYLECRKIVSE